MAKKIERAKIRRLIFLEILILCVIGTIIYVYNKTDCQEQTIVHECNMDSAKEYSSAEGIKSMDPVCDYCPDCGKEITDENTYIWDHGHCTECKKESDFAYCKYCGGECTQSGFVKISDSGMKCIKIFRALDPFITFILILSIVDAALLVFTNGYIDLLEDEIRIM